VLRTPGCAPAFLSRKGAAPCANTISSGILYWINVSTTKPRLHKEAHGTLPGIERETFVRRTRPAENAKHIEWIASPVLQPPK